MGWKRFFAAIAAAPLLCLLLTVSALASNRVEEIAVDVTLESDGSAYVVQTWTGSFDKGTECYFPITNLGEMTLSDLIVSDRGGPYETLPVWDTDASFDEKKNKCGLNAVDNGYEVCWGITEYGENRYAVEYRLGNLVASYHDYDGFLFQFIPSHMSTGPTDVTVRIQTRDGSPLTEKNAAIWAFGYEGQIEFRDAGVLAYTETPLDGGDESVIVLLQLNKGTLSPVRQGSGSFEDLKNRAFEGSDYDSDKEGGGFFVFLLIAVPVVIGLLIFIGGREARKVKKLYKSANYFREAPLAGNLEAAHTLAREFYQSDDDGNLIAAVLMKLLSTGCLEPITERDAGFMGREKETVSLRLVKAPTFRSVAARDLYDLLVQAAGGDSILQERELERYCESCCESMLRVVDTARGDGYETLFGIGCYHPGGSGHGLSGLTDRGRSMLLQLIGFKKYLLDFSLIGERGVSEALIWQDCLTFAALLGIADRVMEQLKTLSPGESAYQRQLQATYYIAYRYHHITYAAAKSAQAQRSSGEGGTASIGGGGGFSGGGSGGGTR